MKRQYSEKDYICTACGRSIEKCTCGFDSDLIFVPEELQEIYFELNCNKGWFTDSIEISDFSEDRPNAEIRIVFADVFSVPTTFPDGWVVNDHRIITRTHNSVAIFGTENVSIIGVIDYSRKSEEPALQYEVEKAQRLKELLAWAKALPENFDA